MIVDLYEDVPCKLTATLPVPASKTVEAGTIEILKEQETGSPAKESEESLLDLPVPVSCPESVEKEERAIKTGENFDLVLKDDTPVEVTWDPEANIFFFSGDITNEQGYRHQPTPEELARFSSVKALASHIAQTQRNRMLGGRKRSETLARWKEQDLRGKATPKTEEPGIAAYTEAGTFSCVLSGGEALQEPVNNRAQEKVYPDETCEWATYFSWALEALRSGGPHPETDRIKALLQEQVTENLVQLAQEEPDLLLKIILQLLE